MEYSKLFKRAWQTVWRYRALWLFGALLALTTSGGLLFLGNRHQSDEVRGITVKVNEDTTIYLPGEGLTVDLTAAGGPVIVVDKDQLQGWQELQELIRGNRLPWSATAVWRGVWAILITAGAVLAATIVLGTIARYVAEAALIRMVSEAEETGERAGVRRGLRLGFSRTAWRLFLIDLAIHVPVAVGFLVLFAVALSPLLLWTSGSTVAGAVGTVFSTGLFLLLIVLGIPIRLVLSPLVQVTRRACGVEGLGVGGSIRRGFGMLAHHLKEIVVVWLAWLGVRLAWVLAVLPLLIVISPALMVSLVAGIVAAGLPAVAVGALLELVLESPFGWIAGAVVGLPIFIVVAIAPMAFLEGLVEIFKSSTWTLAYRELRALEATEVEPARQPDPGSGQAVVAA
jgi:hypothetical protein